MSALREHLSQDIANIVRVGRNLSLEGGCVEAYDAFRDLMFAANELLPLLGEEIKDADRRYLDSARSLADSGIASINKIPLS